MRHRKRQNVDGQRHKLNENCAQNIKYMPSLDSGNYPSCRRSRLMERMAGWDLWPESPK